MSERMTDERLAQVTEIAGRYPSTMAKIASELAEALRAEREALVASHAELDRVEAELFRYRTGVLPKQHISRFADPTYVQEARHVE